MSGESLLLISPRACSGVTVSGGPSVSVSWNQPSSTASVLCRSNRPAGLESAPCPRLTGPPRKGDVMQNTAQINSHSVKRSACKRIAFTGGGASAVMNTALTVLAPIADRCYAETGGRPRGPHRFGAGQSGHAPPLRRETPAPTEAGSPHRGAHCGAHRAIMVRAPGRLAYAYSQTQAVTGIPPMARKLQNPPWQD